MDSGSSIDINGHLEPLHARADLPGLDRDSAEAVETPWRLGSTHSAATPAPDDGVQFRVSITAKRRQRGKRPRPPTPPTPADLPLLRTAYLPPMQCPHHLISKTERDIRRESYAASILVTVPCEHDESTHGEPVTRGDVRAALGTPILLLRPDRVRRRGHISPGVRLVQNNDQPHNDRGSGYNCRPNGQSLPSPPTASSLPGTRCEFIVSRDPISRIAHEVAQSLLAHLCSSRPISDSKSEDDSRSLRNAA